MVVVQTPAISFLVHPSLFADPVPPITACRDTKRIGDISEAYVMAALTNAGYVVSKPFGENARYDLIADDGHRLQRIQVKTGRLRGAVIAFNCYSSHAHRGGRMRPYFGQIDALAVYCPETRKVYLLPESELVATGAHLRLLPTKNGMSKGIRWADRFELP
jgi:hypothetical protein